jgi:hypothetical protein
MWYFIAIMVSVAGQNNEVTFQAKVAAGPFRTEQECKAEFTLERFTVNAPYANSPHFLCEFVDTELLIKR